MKEGDQTYADWTKVGRKEIGKGCVGRRVSQTYRILVFVEHFRKQILFQMNPPLLEASDAFLLQSLMFSKLAECCNISVFRGPRVCDFRMRSGASHPPRDPFPRTASSKKRVELLKTRIAALGVQTHSDEGELKKEYYRGLVSPSDRQVPVRLFDSSVQSLKAYDRC